MGYIGEEKLTSIILEAETERWRWRKMEQRQRKAGIKLKYAAV